MMVIWAKSHKIAVCIAIIIAKEAYDILNNTFVRLGPSSRLNVIVVNI